MSDFRKMLHYIGTEYTTPLGPLKNYDFSKFGRNLEFWWKWKMLFILKTITDRVTLARLDNKDYSFNVCE